MFILSVMAILAVASSGEAKKLRVGMIEVKPFTRVRWECYDTNSSGCEGNGKYEGFSVDLLKLIASNIDGFDYDIVQQKTYGFLAPNGTWMGLIGDIISGQLDLAITPLTITKERYRVVAFTQPFMTTGISAMIRKAEHRHTPAISSYSKLLDPFAPKVWGLIVFAYIGLGLVSCFLHRLASRGDVKSECGSHCSSHVLRATFLLFSFFVAAFYVANLSAQFAVVTEAPVSTVEEIAASTEIQYGVLRGGSTELFFRNSTVPLYRQMWEAMSATGLVSDYAEGIERVRESRGKFVFFLDDTASKYEQSLKPCDTQKIGENLNTIHYGIATQLGSPLGPQLNDVLLGLQEKGELKRLENKWWRDRNQCNGGTIVEHSTHLGLSSLAGVFCLLLTGVAAAAVVAVVEGRKKKGGGQE